MHHSTSNRASSNRWIIGFSVLLFVLPLALGTFGVEAEAWELMLWGGVLVVVSLVLRPAARRSGPDVGRLPMRANESPATSE